MNLYGYQKKKKGVIRMIREYQSFGGTNQKKLRRLHDTLKNINAKIKKLQEIKKEKKK